MVLEEMGVLVGLLALFEAFLLWFGPRRFVNELNSIVLPLRESQVLGVFSACVERLVRLQIPLDGRGGWGYRDPTLRDTAWSLLAIRRASNPEARIIGRALDFVTGRWREFRRSGTWPIIMDSADVVLSCGVFQDHLKPQDQEGVLEDALRHLKNIQKETGQWGIENPIQKTLYVLRSLLAPGVDAGETWVCSGESRSIDDRIVEQQGPYPGGIGRALRWLEEQYRLFGGFPEDIGEAPRIRYMGEAAIVLSAAQRESMAAACVDHVLDAFDRSHMAWGPTAGARPALVDTCWALLALFEASMGTRPDRRLLRYRNKGVRWLLRYFDVSTENDPYRISLVALVLSGWLRARSGNTWLNQ
ncbi:MAG: hypothetical protein HY558_03695 [Euryarchaeota archaeon]|nr:hypothetical protein [Euryarchaeota archaeon]